MSMSKRDYISIAAIIATISDYAELLRISHQLADYFASTNHLFNRTLFLTACDATCAPNEE